MQLVPFLETFPFSVILAPAQCLAGTHGLACPGFCLSCCSDLVQASCCCRVLLTFRVSQAERLDSWDVQGWWDG